MNCKYCDTPLSDGQTVCPTCGQGLGGHKPPAPPPDEPPRRPKSPMQRWITLGVLAVLAVVIGVIVWQTCQTKRSDVRQMERQVVTCERAAYSLTNTELGYYFWSEYFYFIGSSGELLPASLDLAKPLADQMYDQKTTWYQHILDRSLETVRSTMVMVFEADKAGFTLDESYERSLQGVLDQFAQYAQQQNFLKEDGTPDVQAYLADSFGAGATVESFTAYLRDSYLAAAYSDVLYFGPTFTDQEISEHYDLYADSYESDGLHKDGEALRSLRMVLLPPEDPSDEASWQAARESAENLYAAWVSESGSEADFAAMSTTHSAATDGGLLAQMRREDLTGELADWTFASGRKAGDAAVLRTDDGWAIAYFVSVSNRAAWHLQAEQDLRADTYQNTLRGLLDQYSFVSDTAGIVIATPNGLYSGATQAATGSSVTD